METRNSIELTFERSWVLLKPEIIYSNPNIQQDNQKINGCHKKPMATRQGINRNGEYYLHLFLICPLAGALPYTNCFLSKT